MMQEESYMNLLPKYENYLQKLQINLEQLFHDNQNFANSVFEIRTELKLFKEELSTIMINKSLFNMEFNKNDDNLGETNIISKNRKNSLIFYKIKKDEKIQKILKMIEIIEKFTEKFKGNKEIFSTHCTQITEEELTFSNNFITDDHSNQKLTLSDENHTGKSENLSAQLPKKFSRLPNKLIHILTKSNYFILIYIFFFLEKWLIFLEMNKNF